MRWLFIVHRYLGMALGVLMAVWCCSGVVMMYVAYPALSESARLNALAPIDWDDCCAAPENALADPERVRHFNIEMLAGDPVLRFLPLHGPERMIDLKDGLAISRVSPEQAATVASEFGQAHGYWDPPAFDGTIDYDQWTVAGSFDADRPLYRFRIADAAQTELYVSSTSGKLVQRTTARERLWNRLGSIPHWLYFAQLRRNGRLWSRVVIYTSLGGCLLTLIGISIGIQQFLRRPSDRWSGYRGLLLWHHIPGLLFGLLALTWVASGLISMNPWGFLESATARPEQRALLGDPPTGADVKESLRALARAAINSPLDVVVSIDSASLFGRLYVVATSARAARWRLDARAAQTPLTFDELTREARALAHGSTFMGPERLSSGDRYYYSRPDETVDLPTYRVILKNAERTRYYLDPIAGALVWKADRAAKEYRWLHDAVHRMDFASGVRVRPLWDVLTLVLMSGVTWVATTGAYLGLRRLVGMSAHRRGRIKAETS